MLSAFASSRKAPIALVMSVGLPACPSDRPYACVIACPTGRIYAKFDIGYYYKGARGSAVGLDTALKAGRSRVRFPMLSLEFFIDIILLVALWPWGRLSL